MRTRGGLLPTRAAGVAPGDADQLAAKGPLDRKGEAGQHWSRRQLHHAGDPTDLERNMEVAADGGCDPTTK